jgi:hypothetical protein
MANMLHKFKDRDVQRVIKAARSAGLDPAAVEVDPHTGRIKVHSRIEPVDSANPWDKAVADVSPKPAERRKPAGK